MSTNKTAFSFSSSSKRTIDTTRIVMAGFISIGPRGVKIALSRAAPIALGGSALHADFRTAATLSQLLARDRHSQLRQILLARFHELQLLSRLQLQPVKSCMSTPWRCNRDSNCSNSMILRAAAAIVAAAAPKNDAV